MPRTRPRRYRRKPSPPPTSRSRINARIRRAWQPFRVLTRLVAAAWAFYKIVRGE